MTQSEELKAELVKQAEQPQKETKLKKNMSIPEIVKALGPGTEKSTAKCDYTGTFYSDCAFCIK